MHDAAPATRQARHRAWLLVALAAQDAAPQVGHGVLRAQLDGLRVVFLGAREVGHQFVRAAQVHLVVRIVGMCVREARVRGHGFAAAALHGGHDAIELPARVLVEPRPVGHELRDGEVRTYVVDPRELGIDLADPGALAGGDPQANAAIARNVLAGRPGAHRDIVVLNAAAGLVAGGAVDDLAAGVAVAASSLDEGRAAGVLDQLAATSQAAAAAGR